MVDWMVQRPWITINQVSTECHYLTFNIREKVRLTAWSPHILTCYCIAIILHTIISTSHTDYFGKASYSSRILPNAGVKYTAYETRSSSVVERPRDASCHCAVSPISIPLKLCMYIVPFWDIQRQRMEWPRKRWRGRSRSFEMAPFDRS